MPDHPFGDMITDQTIHRVHAHVLRIHSFDRPGGATAGVTSWIPFLEADRDKEGHVDAFTLLGGEFSLADIPAIVRTLEAFKVFAEDGRGCEPQG